MNALERQLDRLDRKQGSSVADAAFPRHLGGRLLLAGRATPMARESHDTPARDDRKQRTATAPGASRPVA